MSLLRSVLTETALFLARVRDAWTHDIDPGPPTPFDIDVDWEPGEDWEDDEPTQPYQPVQCPIGVDYVCTRAKGHEGPCALVPQWRRAP